MAARSMWHSLPDDLAGNILSRISAGDVLACRCVCKSWNTLLRSDSFLRLAAATSPSSPYILAHCTDRYLAAYSLDYRRWRKIPLPSSASARRAAPLASSGGLILFTLRCPHSTELLVVNPFTSAVRHLPLMECIRSIQIVGMSKDDDGFYRIVVTGPAEPTTHDWVTEVYDSRNGNWAVHSKCDDEYLQYWYNNPPLYLAGSFYCVVDLLGLAETTQLISYDLKKQRWENVGMGMSPTHLKRRMRRSLVVCGEKLLLVGVLEDCFGFIEVKVWEADCVRKEWVDVATVPDEVLVERVLLDPLKCFGCGNMLCLTIDGGLQWIVYHLLDKTWQCLPETQLEDIVSRSSLVGMLFEPSLSASV